MRKDANGANDAKKGKWLFIGSLLAVILGIVMCLELPSEYMAFGAIIILFAGQILLLWLLAVLRIVSFTISSLIAGDYFESYEFSAIKSEAAESVEECYAMHEYVTRAKKEYYSKARLLFAEGYLEKTLFIDQNDTDVEYTQREYRCSVEDYDKAEASAYEFLFELIGIEENNDALADLVDMSNALFIAKECSVYPFKKMISILQKFSKKLPLRIRFFARGLLGVNLGFKDPLITDVEAFKLVIKSESKQFNNRSLTVVFDTETLKEFIAYAAKRLRSQGNDLKPIFLLTEKLAKDVLERDDNTCLVCGASKANDSTLFLEPEYIESEDSGASANSGRLRTVCWKCKWDGMSGNTTEATAQER